MSLIMYRQTFNLIRKIVNRKISVLIKKLSRGIYMKIVHTKVLILAAGKGTRMKSDLAKVLHKVNGQPMVNHVLNMLKDVSPDEIYLIIGHQADKVKEATQEHKIIYVEQKEQLGTGHAVMVVEPQLTNYEGITIILCGDVPLLQAATVNKLREIHCANDLSATIVTTKLDDPKHYGRIIRNKENLVEKIVEYRDASETERTVNEINSGIYCFNTKDLFNALKQIKNKNDQKEYYLTDVIEILVKANKKIGAYCIDTAQEIHGVNDINDLELAEKFLLLQSAV